MSAFLFLPSAWSFLTSSRESGTEFASGMTVYPLQYYWDLITKPFTSSGCLWTMTGFAGIFMLVIPMLIKKRKQYKSIAIILGLFFLMTLLPAFGSIMNGFAGPSNRWTFAIPLYVALSVAVFYQHRYSYTTWDYVLMGSSLIIFTGIAEWAKLKDGIGQARLVPISIAFVILLIMIAVGMLNKRELKKEKVYKVDWKNWSNLFILLLIMANLVYNAREFYYPGGQDAMGVLLDYGAVDKRFKNTFDGAEKEVPESKSNPYRIGVTTKDKSIPNNLLYLNRMGTTSYLSITNGYVAELMQQLDVANFEMNRPVRNGLDDRPIINNLLNVKYILTDSKNQKYLPYGYKVIKKPNEEEQTIVAKTRNSFPFAYASTRFLTEKVFETMNPVEKEEYLSKGFIREEKEVNQDKNRDLFQEKSSVEEVGYTLTEPKGIKLNKSGQFQVSKKNGSLQLEIEDVEKIKGKEVYLYLENIDFSPTESNRLKKSPGEFKINAKFNKISKTIRQRDVISISTYVKRDNMLFSLGHQPNKVITKDKKVKVAFSQPGNYTINNSKLLALPVGDSYKKEVEKKKENQLAISEFQNEKIVGEITQEEPATLVTSIPYSDGWAATVNGEPVETEKVNYGFVGIPLQSGESLVTFSYETPFLKIGTIISVIGTGLFFLTAWIEKYKTKRKQ